MSVLILGDVCTPSSWIDDFDAIVGSEESFFNIAGCRAPQSMTQSNGILRLQLFTQPTCLGGSIIQSKDTYTSGYTEAKLRVGGQGNDFTGIVYTFITQSDDSNKTADEIDFESLGRLTTIGTIQTNWFHNGSKTGVNSAHSPVPGIANQEWFILSITWNSSYVAWGINGVTVRSVSGVTMSKPQYIWASIWDGSTYSYVWAGVTNWNASNVNQTNFWIDVDYIKYISSNNDPVFDLCAPADGSWTVGNSSDGGVTTDGGSNAAAPRETVMLWTVLMAMILSIVCFLL